MDVIWMGEDRVDVRNGTYFHVSSIHWRHRGRIVYRERVIGARTVMNKAIGDGIWKVARTQS